MTIQIWILVLAVFAAVVLSRLGRHRYTRRQRLLTLAVIAVLIGKYVRGMPTAGNDVVLAVVCAGVGAAFGLGMLAATSVHRDQGSGEVWVRAGLTYLTLWVIMLGARIVFAYSATGWARHDVAQFFLANHLTNTAVTPAFVLMTIASLAVVTVGTAWRASSLTHSQVSYSI
jgi:hypothetical protein